MKRGISPLISAVLLIAFVIALFLVVTNWVQKDVVSESMGTTDEQLAGQLECLNTNIDVTGLCLNAAGDLEFNADNTGETDITGLKLRALAADGTAFSEDIVASGAPLARVYTKTTGAIDIGTITPTRVEVYPVIASGLCKDQIEIITNIPTPC